MEEAIVYLIIMVIGMCISAASKKKKTQKKADPQPYAPAKPTQPPVKPAMTAQERAKMADDRRLWNNMEQQWAAQAGKKAAQQPIQLQMTLTEKQPTVHTHVEPDCVTHDAPGGSLAFRSNEGKDPCHEKQFTLRAREEEEDAEVPGLTLDWSGEGLVKAFVMQEVLTRPSQRRAR